jgi:hypothetical protein
MNTNIRKPYKRARRDMLNFEAVLLDVEAPTTSLNNSLDLISDDDPTSANFTDLLSNSSDLSDNSESEFLINKCILKSQLDIPFDQKCNEQSFSEIISQWALNHNIKHNAIDDLLKALKPYHPELPLNARTLLSTPRQTQVQVIDPGHYYHFGLENCIKELIINSPSKLVCSNIEILVNVDGLPISKSSGSQFYPILCSLFNQKSSVQLVGLYHGYEKPKDANMFLSMFVDECIKLSTNGLIVNNDLYSIKIKGFVADVPAKSFIKYTKGHTGYMSCSKCEIEGSYISNSVCFPEISNLKLRLDSDFRKKLQEQHHTGTSIIEKLPFIDMIKSFPLDYMHLICLGVVKKLIVTLWIGGKPPHKLSYSQTSNLSILLINQVKNIPKEFSRKPRSLSESKRWKASEFRQFLFYTGPVVLKNVLTPDMYRNFICLHVAMRILSNEKYFLYIDYAEQLLKYFVSTFGILYGAENISHNIHNLLHITQDVKEFGILDKFSTFEFENYMQTLKRMVRKTAKPLQQVINRKHELQNLSKNTKLVKHFPYTQKIHVNGPIIPNLPIVSQYEQLLFENFTLYLVSSDNCCYLSNGTIVDIKNYVTTSTEIFIIGREYLSKQNFFIEPCNSSDIDIYLVSDEIGELKFWNVNEIAFKCVKISFNEKFVVFPLLHTY